MRAVASVRFAPLRVARIFQPFTVWLAAMFALLIIAAPPAIGETLYTYDPGQSYGGHSWSSTDDALAAKFTLPSYDSVATQLRIRISYTQEAITAITACIWDNDSGHPGTLLWSQNVADVNGPTTDASSYWWWNAIDISPGLSLSAGATVFAGYTSTSFEDIGPSWSANTSMDGIEGSWYRSESSATWSYKTYDRMMQLDVVPEPSTVVLLGSLVATGGVAFAWRRRKQRA